VFVQDTKLIHCDGEHIRAMLLKKKSESLQMS